MNRNILTVAQVNAYIKKLFEMDYIVKQVWIQGEVSNCKVHSSGHIYFTLKDAMSSIACVMFKGYRQSGAQLKDGMKVIAQGSVSVYERSGQYQLYVKEFIEDGIGLLYKRFEELKERLEDLGWFSSELKKPIPFYPRKVGIVTSETGSVIADIVNISKRRNPYIQLVLYPTLVQGTEAKNGIVEGIKTLDAMEDVDVIIVGRGGGSFEDLFSFNEESVARAIFEANTPIISAVGHETDFTIADFVSDLRAPTPSAAAELAIPSYIELNDYLTGFQDRLYKSLSLKIDQKKSLIALYEAKFERYHPKRSIEQMLQYLIDLQDQLETSLMIQIKDKRAYLELLSERLKRVSPIEKLKDGYVFAMDLEGRPIKTIQNVSIGKEITIQLADGQFKAQVLTREEGLINEIR